MQTRRNFKREKYYTASSNEITKNNGLPSHRITKSYDNKIKENQKQQNNKGIISKNFKLKMNIRVNKPKTVNPNNSLKNKANRINSINKVKSRKQIPYNYKREKELKIKDKVDFIPYSLQSYKEKFSYSKYTQLGGLGPNIDSKEWNSAMNKRKRMSMVSKSIDAKNKQKYKPFAFDGSLKNANDEK